MNITFITMQDNRKKKEVSHYRQYNNNADL